MMVVVYTLIATTRSNVMKRMIVTFMFLIIVILATWIGIKAYNVYLLANNRNTVAVERINELGFPAELIK